MYALSLIVLVAAVYAVLGCQVRAILYPKGFMDEFYTYCTHEFNTLRYT